MKLYKNIFRIWIAFVSAISFLGGWAIFAHSNKPAALLSNNNANTNANNVQSLQPQSQQGNFNTFNNSGSNFQSLPQFSQQQSTSPFFSSPRLRTRGS